ncbi:MAG: nucleotide sugar dehydrogenase [Salibacteraceae bacterium]
MIEQLINKQEKLGVIGLGYVGLPIALEFAKKLSVVGFDINAVRVDMMKNHVDPSEELEAKDFEGCDIEFTANIDDLKDVKFFIVAVPTPIDEYNQPNLRPLLGASSTVGKVLKKGDYVVFESTVYPGCTEDDCVPVLEAESGLKFVEDFKVGYSPERINPGDKEHTITKILKVVSGCDEESLDIIAKVYEMIIIPGVHRTTSIKVAEAAKIIENTQRDLNIALMNELSIIFNRIGINTFEVLEAAGTKWNFLPFKPGLVGGHCIGVDPYYLTFKAEGVGYHAKVINSGRYVNDSMGFYTAKQTVKKVLATGKNIAGARILMMGATFKENVSDIRNSKVSDVVKELQSYRADVEVIDPYACSKELMEEYHFGLVDKPTGIYDAVIVAVNHAEYVNMTESDFQALMDNEGILVDLKGIYRGKINHLTYWSF